MPLTEHLMDQTELLDLVNDAVILTDADGTITYWNQGACHTYGWQKIEALGQNVARVTSHGSFWRCTES